MRRQCGTIGVIALIVGLGACSNAGEDRVVAITATGRIVGVVYFDANGSGLPDGADRAVPGLALRVVLAGTRDTVAEPVTQTDGSFSTVQLPVGRYTVVVPAATLGDSTEVVQLEDSVLTVGPDGEVAVTVGIGYPRRTIAEARALAVGRKIFVEGIALTSLGVFGDTTTHVDDGSGAIRAVRVRPVVQLAGDSVRLSGSVAVRDGQVVLDDVTVLVLNINRPMPPPAQVSTGVAAAADGGRLDAALALVRNVAIADTATGAAGFAVTLDDGSGALTVLLDADIVFDRTGLDPGVFMDATGVLVPDGAGAWRLKPRGNGDLVRR